MLWNDTKTWPADERWAWNWLWTGEPRATEGLFLAPLEAIAVEVFRELDPGRAERAIAGLVDRGRCVYDFDCEWVFVAAMLPSQPPSGHPSLKGAANRVTRAPRESQVWRLFVDSVEAHCPDLLPYLEDPDYDPKKAPQAPLEEPSSHLPSVIEAPSEWGTNVPSESPFDSSNSSSISNSPTLSGVRERASRVGPPAAIRRELLARRRDEEAQLRSTTVAVDLTLRDLLQNGVGDRPAEGPATPHTAAAVSNASASEFSTALQGPPPAGDVEVVQS